MLTHKNVYVRVTVHGCSWLEDKTWFEDNGNGFHDSYTNTGVTNVTPKVNYSY